MRLSGHRNSRLGAWAVKATSCGLFFFMVALSAPVAFAAPAGPSLSKPMDRLIADTKGTAIISRDSATGYARFIRFPQGASRPALLSPTRTARSQADKFLSAYGGTFGMSNPGQQLYFTGSRQIENSNGTQLTYQQVHEGIPVFGGMMNLRFNSANEITSVNGTFVAGLQIKSTTVDVDAQRATETALNAAAAAQAGDSPLRVSPASLGLVAVNSEMLVFRSGLVQGVAGSDHLVYEMEVANDSASIREFVYVDAHTGAVVDRISGIHTALDRDVSEVNLANVVWEDSNGDPDPIPGGWMGGTAQNVADWQDEIDGARETYNVFASMAGWDSYDNAGATMRTVNNDPSIFCPNANWNGTSTNYCTGVTADDTVAHEWGHAYTDFTSNLIYQWQSGALNESYSDIWGEVVDFLNARGTDAPDTLRSDGGCSVFGQGSNDDNSYRWLSGEDDPAFGGAIRDMWTPTCYGDPGKVSDAEYWCTTGDSGGVHFNSGVPNHAFALMVDGGNYNGKAISGIGLTKAAHIHWAAQNMLTPASNFVDHADAVEQACTDLLGIDLPAISALVTNPGPSGEIIEANDCTQVAAAVAAVELRTPPTQCGFEPLLDPDAPALCDGLGSVQSIFSENWEGGVLPAGWTAGTHSVANPPSFDTPDWAVVDNLPAGASGTYSAFVENIIAGDCAADTEAGALFLDSPVISLPAGQVPRVAFDHWVATEAGWDGGNVKLSVNGGPWTLVPGTAYEFNPYNQSLNGGGNDNPLAGEEAFTGTDGGAVSGSWGQSQLSLLGLAFPGDDVQIRFDFGIDGCNGVIGWYVDDVNVYSCSSEEPPVCGDGILDVGEQCDDGNDLDGDGCSSVCQVESGWSCTDPTPPGTGENVIADHSFEGGPFGGAWNESSTNFGTPICDVGACGTGTGTGPSDGDFWTWFGGIGAYELGIVNQDVSIPATATDLTFDLEQFVCDSGNDYVAVFVDANLEFISLGSDPLCGTLGYTPQTVDVSAYADGGVHEIHFQSEVFATNGGGSNFFIDNVVLSDNVVSEGSPSVCTPIQEDIVCHMPSAVGFDEGIPSTWSVVDNEGTGVVWTDIENAFTGGFVPPGNHTGGEGEAASVNSDANIYTDYDTEMRSNLFSLPSIPNFDTVELNYLANFQSFSGDDFLDVDISSDGGGSWTNLLSWNEDHGTFGSSPGEAVTLDVSAYIGMDDLMLRWRYYNPELFDWDWYAQIDDVSLYCEYPHMDIHPGGFPNSINVKKKQGVIPVAILTNEAFDAATVDVSTIEFGPGGATVEHAGGHLEDVDGDGDTDLVMHFLQKDAAIQCGDTTAAVTGLTYGGDPVDSVDSVNPVPCK